MPVVRCIVIGGGGHARVLIDSLLAGGESAAEGILDENRSLWGTEIQGVRFLGGDELLAEMAGRGVTHFIVGVGGVGDNGPRRRLFQLGLASGLAPLTVRHPSVVCSPWAQVGPGCALLPAAVINAGSVLGLNVIVNSAAVVEHDCVVGDHVHVATGARLAGAVRVDEGAHIGAGATIRQGIRIGARAIVGMGAVVIRDVDPETVVVGIPARPRGTFRR